MAKYKRKPLEVEAFQNTGQCVTEWPEWAQKAGFLDGEEPGIILIDGGWYGNETRYLIVKINHWIVRTEKDEYEVYSNKRFIRKFRLVDKEEENKTKVYKDVLVSIAISLKRIADNLEIP